LIRWCTTTYTEIFSAWLHLKAVRLYVESVLRYGLPFSAQAALLEPHRGKERQLRDVLKNLYGQRLAGNNAALTQQLDPNEPDISGLGADFYPYVYLPLNISE
jgi:V-type H+-transporting ATPase subunit C